MASSEMLRSCLAVCGCSPSARGARQHFHPPGNAIAGCWRGVGPGAQRTVALNCAWEPQQACCARLRQQNKHTNHCRWMRAGAPAGCPSGLMITGWPGPGNAGRAAPGTADTTSKMSAKYTNTPIDLALACLEMLCCAGSVTCISALGRILGQAASLRWRVLSQVDYCFVNRLLEGLGM